MVSKLATKVRPRYHVCGGRDVFYARQPYLNKDLGAGVRYPPAALMTAQAALLHIHAVPSVCLQVCRHREHSAPSSVTQYPLLDSILR